MTNEITMPETAKPDFMDTILGAESAESKEEPEEKGEKEPEVTAAPKQTFVEHGALHEERERRKELQKAVDTERERNTRLEERTNKLFELMAQREQPKEEFTDPLKTVETKLNEVISTVNKTQSQIDAERKAYNEEQGLVQKYLGSINAYTKDKPDISEARDFLLNSRGSELRAMGYNDNEVAIQIRNEEKMIVEKAYSDGTNPAERIYNISTMRGYKGKVEPQKTSIEDLDKGLKAAKSLGSGGKTDGNTPWDGLSADDLADMTKEEFDVMWGKMEKQASRKH